MRGAIFFSGKYGSTEQYANWIGEATGLSVFDIKDDGADLAGYDYLVLGSSIVDFKLTIRQWAKANRSKLNSRSKILYSVSGKGPSDKLNGWVAASFPPMLMSQMEHVVLGGRLGHSKVNCLIQLSLRIGSLINPDPASRKEDRYGFNHVDKDSIEPIGKMIEWIQSTQGAT